MKIEMGKNEAVCHLLSKVQDDDYQGISLENILNILAECRDTITVSQNLRVLAFLAENVNNTAIYSILENTVERAVPAMKGALTR